MPRCEVHNLSYPERLGACPRCTTEPDASGLSGYQREQIDTALSLTSAMMARYAIDPVVRQTVLARLLAVTIVTERAHLPWPDVRTEALAEFAAMLNTTREQLAQAQSLTDSAND